MDGNDYPMGDEKTYQNVKKFGSSVSPNKKVIRKGKVQTAKQAAEVQMPKRRTSSDGFMPKQVKAEKISGQCEHCGHEYKMMHSMRGEPKCPGPGCGKKTQNWDTVHGSTMAPSIVKVNMKK